MLTKIAFVYFLVHVAYFVFLMGSLDSWKGWLKWRSLDSLDGNLKPHILRAILAMWATVISMGIIYSYRPVWFIYILILMSLLYSMLFSIVSRDCFLEWKNDIKVNMGALFRSIYSAFMVLIGLWVLYVSVGLL